MKFLKKLLFIIFSFTIIFSCSKDSDSQGDNIPIRNSEIINYLSTPDSEGQLLSEVYIEEDKATTYFYGSTDANGEGLLTQSLAYKVDDSDRIEYVVLDELQRVKYTYSEVNGVKENEIHSFTYPEEGIVNYIILKRDWTTLEDDILYFSTVETNGEEFIANNLYGKGLKIKSPPEDTAVLANVGVAVTILAVVGTLLYAKAPALARILAALAYTTAAIADEPPAANIDPNAPSSPETTIIDNQCSNSNLSVIIGVDPGNVLVAIVNGDSATYDFYWSTGETATTPITHVITAPDDGDYYVMVRDENGCIAFASTNSEDFNYEGTWLMTVNNLDGSLHHYERVVFDINGVSTYNETNIPDQNTGWYSTGYTYYINYNASSGLINITVGGTGLNFPFVVNSVLDTRFFGDGDYYSAGYDDYFNLILDRE
ncbi:hypothetical protein GCM10023311_13130 [Flaviramulus aquimarinus]|uniref:Uncharacterized protein n=1 Tax=Flaviramulus aquimarinus TaxID=1170456 RepID=A0ABP9F0X5_9FLAO